MKFLSKLSLLVIFLTSMTFAQTTYYVNVQTGLDGYNGLSADVTGVPGEGPKQTIQNAIAAASSGDIISVAYANGNLYNEKVVVGIGAASKSLTFTSTGGAPNVVSFTINNANAAAATPNNTETFTGPFNLTGLAATAAVDIAPSLILTAGKVVGASNLTVARMVVRTAGTVDSQLDYAPGLVHFMYNGGVAITSGFELPAANNTTNMGDLITDAVDRSLAGAPALGIPAIGVNTALTLNESKNMNGQMFIGAALNLGTGTLTVTGLTTGAAPTPHHITAADITNGTLAFSMTGAVNLTGNFKLPNITATKATAGLAVLTLPTNAAATTIASIAASGNASVTAANAITIGDVSNSGAGAVTLFATSGNHTTAKSLTNTGAGSIFVNPPAAFDAAITNNVAQSGTGFINIAPTTGGAGVITVGGTLTNNPELVLPAALLLPINAASNYGVVILGDRTTTVTGLTTVATLVSGTNGATATVWNNAGEVRFAADAVNVTLTGGVTINSSNTFAKGTGALTVSNCGGVQLANTTGTLTVGPLNVATTWPAVTGATSANNGDFTADARTGAAATVGIGATVVSSTGANGANGNVLINMAAANNPGITFASLTTTGAAGGFVQVGGYVAANGEDVSVTGSLINERSSNAAHIQFGTLPLAGVNYAIGGNLVSSGISQINFLGFNGAAAENIAVTGNVVMTGGTIQVDATAPLSGTGSIEFGGADISGGLLDLGGTAATAVMEVVFNGTSKFYAGTIDVSTTVAAAAVGVHSTAAFAVGAGVRVMQLGGLINEFATATTAPTFVVGNTLLLVQATTVISHQSMIGNSTTTVWPGQAAIANITNLSPAVTWSGGNFRFLGHTSFHTSLQHIDGVTLFVGGQLAPNVGSGHFYNHKGYGTVNNGFVSLNSLAASSFGGAGTFENFEVDADDRLDGDYADINVTALGTITKFTKLFNLTAGNILTSNNIIFNNTTDYPTIVRNAGLFNVAPTFTSYVNVYYIGLDKTAALELPAATDKLWDLTVATTNDAPNAITAGHVPGRGAVTTAVATTVNGTLTVNAGQALVLDAILTMAGEAINLNGDITNTGAANTLTLARVAGTTITGSGWLPDIAIAATSLGNKIDGAMGLVTNMLGTDDSRGAAAAATPQSDVILSGAGAVVADGDLTFPAGTGALQVMFGAGALNGTNLGVITTANAGNALQVSANMATSDAMVHVAGDIQIDDTFTWSYRNAAAAQTAGATITGPGLLAFRQQIVYTATAVATASPVIAAPVDITFGTGNAANTWTLDPAGTGHLTMAGDVTVTTGTVVLGSAAVARNLTLTGSNLTMTANSSFLAHDGTGGAGALIDGTLILNAATAPLTWSHTGTPTLGNVTIANDVTLGGTGLGLTIYRNFTHTAGLLDFSSRNITIDNITADIDAGLNVTAAAGTYTNVAGTYTATTGYLNMNTTSMDQGANNFTIPNLRFGANAAATVAAQTGIMTVLANLDCRQPGVVDINSASTGLTTVLAVDSGATVTHTGVTATAFDVAPTYIGTITLVAANTAAATIDATIWPATPANLVTTFVVNSAAARATFLPGDRSVTHEIDLYVGDLDLDANNVAGTDDRTLTLENSIIKVRDTGRLFEGNGTFVYTDPDVFFQVGAAYNTNTNGVNFTPVNNLTVEAYNAGVGPVTIGAATTVKGDLTVNAPMNTVATISLHGDAFIATAVNVGGTVAFVGETDDQTITVPAAGANFGNLTIDKVAGNVLLDGGGLTLGAGNMITFLRGLFITGDDNLLTLDRTNPVLGVGNAIQAFNHIPMNGYVSHVVGNVALDPNMDPSPAFGRNEWPVGSMTEYRPVSLTFLNTVSVALGVPITVNHVTVKPAGIVGLPINIDGTDIARYPDFYWNIVSGVSLSQIEFDLELSATGFTSWGNAYEDIVILRRNGDIEDTENTWVLQGTDYDNFLSNQFPTVINRNSRGGLRSEGAIFTYGMPTRLTMSGTLPDRTIGLETVTIDITDLFGGNLGELTYNVSSTNNTVVSVSDADFTETTFDIEGLVDGTATVTVRATDENGDFTTTSFGVTVNGLVGIEDAMGIPTEYEVAQNFPNPFNPTTKIRFGLPEQSNVVLKVYNILGEQVANLVSEILPAGYHTINFDATQLTSGLYIYRIEAGNFVEVKKMMLMK